MPLVFLGHEDGQVTTAHVPDADSWTDDERFRAVTADSAIERGVWAHHKEHSGSSRPAWIESSDPEFAEKLARHFDCPVGRPDEDALPAAVDEAFEGTE